MLERSLQVSVTRVGPVVDATTLVGAAGRSCAGVAATLLAVESPASFQAKAR